MADVPPHNSALGLSGSKKIVDGGKHDKREEKMMIGRYAAKLSIFMMLIGGIGIYEYIGKKTESLSAGLILFSAGLVGWLVLRKRRD